MDEEDGYSFTPHYSFQNIDTGLVTDFVDEDAPQQRAALAASSDFEEGEFESEDEEGGGAGPAAAAGASQALAPHILLPLGTPASARILGSVLARDPVGRMYTLYVVQVTRAVDGLTWPVYRRYSEFRDLHERLRRQGYVVTGLPPKKMLGTFDPVFIETRRSGLERWLQVLLASSQDRSAKNPFLSEDLNAFLAREAGVAPPGTDPSTVSDPALASIPNLGAAAHAAPPAQIGQGGDGSIPGAPIPPGQLPRGPAAGGGGDANSTQRGAQPGPGGHRGPGAAAAGGNLSVATNGVAAGAAGAPVSPAAAPPGAQTLASPAISIPGRGVPAAIPASARGGAARGGGQSRARGAGRGASGAVDVRTAQMRDPMGLHCFDLIRVIGKGSFGKVMLVRRKGSGKLFAMKALNKPNIKHKRQVSHTKTERRVLGYTQHPFIVCMHYAFQTGEKLYFVLDYCAGGELFFHLGQHGRFPESLAVFYAAEMVLALKHLHDNGVVYRDLKPENILLDEEGHIKLADFGLSKEGITEQAGGTHSFCGTAEYLAPEILNRQGHGTAVDWWCLGMVLHEMIVGVPPWYSENRKKLFADVKSAPLEFPRGVSANAQRAIRGLLNRDPNQRFTAEELMREPIFAHIDWSRLYARELPPPFVPRIRAGSLDTSNFDVQFTQMSISHEDREGHGAAGSRTFEGFTFVRENEYLRPHADR